MFGWFDNKPLFDAATTQWLFDVYAWALGNLDGRFFFELTPLVLPDERFFPGRADSVQGMAELVFSRVRDYAGVAHWPWVVLDGTSCPVLAAPRVSLEGPLRQAADQAKGGALSPRVENPTRLPVLYDPKLVRSPEALIAGYAHTLAHYLASAVAAPLPGGEENRPHIEELLGVYLGFGLMFANSAYVPPARSCGSCGGPQVARTAFLSQYHMTYALAIFCALKRIPPQQARPHLKSSLRGYFKRCTREMRQYDERITALRQIAQ